MRVADRWEPRPRPGPGRDRPAGLAAGAVISRPTTWRSSRSVRPRAFVSRPRVRARSAGNPSAATTPRAGR